MDQYGLATHGISDELAAVSVVEVGAAVAPFITSGCLCSKSE